ncbi:MAG: hypothetical protein CL778_03235 [Chloroflexi bacterium]|nr:hypothetical protein [Chloroflexota bacterium]
MGHYETLGVSKNATDSEIKKRYRELARELHPDLNHNDKSASENFKKINDAYDVLSDKNNRRDYDQFGDNWKHAEELRKAGYSNSNFSGVNDFFNHSFTNQNPFGDIFSGSKSKPRVNEVTVEITLEEAFYGTQRRLTLRDNHSGNKTIEIKIPHGITDGKTIRLNTSSGVIDVKVKIKRHLNFQVQANNLKFKLNISMFDAIFGSDIEIPTIDGKISLFVPPGTPNGKKFRITGKGMKLMDSDSRGDMYVQVEISLPRDFTDKELKELKKMKDKRKDNLQ